MNNNNNILQPVPVALYLEQSDDIVQSTETVHSSYSINNILMSGTIS